MFFFCPVCIARRKSKSSDLCSVCQPIVSASRLPFAPMYLATGRDNPVYLETVSLFRYTDVLRELVHRAKLKRQWSIYNYLTRSSIGSEPMLTSWLMGAVGLVPAPSSLGGRWRGQFDLAYGFARALSHQVDIPVLRSPLELRWRWHKRAMRRGRRPQRIENAIPPGVVHKNNEPFIVIVDDILTSGSTVIETAQAFPDHHIKVLTLALAR